MKAIELNPQTGAAFSHHVERFPDDSWHNVISLFQDATIFQTVSFCAAKSPSMAIEHLMIREHGKEIATAQVRLVHIPLMRRPIAYVFWGPLCRRNDEHHNWSGFREALRVLRKKYVEERHMNLRISPPFVSANDDQWLAAFRDEGYIQARPIVSRRTIVVDLDAPLEELRKGLDKKWRNCLNSAEKTEIQVINGTGRVLFEQFQEIYWEMLHRKHIAEPGDIEAFKRMQAMLPEHLKMQVFVALENGRPCAGVICSAIGRRGLYLFGATADAGMKNKASYLVQWRVVQWLKERGCVEYDLHGSNAEFNPGVYSFKMGLSGRNGREVESLGHFEAYPGPTSRLILKVADRANHEIKRLKALCQKY